MLVVSVVSVEESTGVRHLELAWRGGDHEAGAWADAAARAAERWWEETDQSGEAHLTMRVSDSATGIWSDYAVTCAPVIRIEAREVNNCDGKAARVCADAIEYGERGRDVAAALRLIARRCACAASGSMPYSLERCAEELRREAERLDECAV